MDPADVKVRHFGPPATRACSVTHKKTYVRSVNGVPVDPETGNVNVSAGGGSGISLTDDGTGLVTIKSGSTGLTDDGTGLFTIGA